MKILFVCLLLTTTLGLNLNAGEAFNPTEAYSKHKGFMVFLNWYFLQPAPMIVTKHFKKIKSLGALTHYRGRYGAFHQVDISVCNQKITEVLARTKSLPRGINVFLKTWLEDRLYQKIIIKQDARGESSFLMASSPDNLNCASLTSTAIDGNKILHISRL